MEGLLYLVRTGCQWRVLPPGFSPWQTVYHHFRHLLRAGVLAAFHDRLRAFTCALADKSCRPTVAVLDSQTVRSVPHACSMGYDAGKKIKNRKRFVLADTPGLVLGVTLLPTHTPERAGEQEMLPPLLPYFPWSRKL